MTADITEVGLAELLHLPQVQVRAEQVGPGRQGGPLLVVIGISLIGLALWGWATDTLGWSAFALAALGTASTMTGVRLPAHAQLDQQPTGSTLVHGPVQTPPPLGDLHGGLVHEPVRGDAVAARPLRRPLPGPRVRWIRFAARADVYPAATSPVSVPRAMAVRPIRSRMS